MLAAMQAPGPSFILPEFQPPQLYHRPAFRPEQQAALLPRLHLLQPQPTAPLPVAPSQLSVSKPVALPLVTAAVPRPEPTESSFDRLRSAPLPGLASLAALASSQRAAVTEEPSRPAKVDHRPFASCAPLTAVLGLRPA